jgi:hypothetical protein
MLVCIIEIRESEKCEKVKDVKENKKRVCREEMIFRASQYDKFFTLLVKYNRVYMEEKRDMLEKENIVKFVTQ